MKSYKVIAFDLDGTLTDPYEGLTSAHKYALVKMGVFGGERAALKKYIGPPLVDVWKEDFGFSDEEAHRAVALFREYFGVYGWWDNKLYEGVPELLEKIRERGYKIALATSKPDLYAVKILKRFGIFEYFDFVGAATLDHKRDKKCEVLEYVISSLGISDAERESVLLVGDTRYDLEGADTTGVDFLGVLYGYGKREDFPKGTPLVSSVADILEYL